MSVVSWQMITYGGKTVRKVVGPNNKGKRLNSSFQSPYSRVCRNPREIERVNERQEQQKKEREREKQEGGSEEGREKGRSKFTNETHLPLVQLLFLSRSLILVLLHSATTHHL